MLIFVFVFVLYCIVTPTWHAGKERDDISKSAHLLRHHLHHPLHPGGLLRHGGSHIPYERLQPCHDCRLHVSLRLELHQVCQCGYVCVCMCVGVCLCGCVCVCVNGTLIAGTLGSSASLEICWIRWRRGAGRWVDVLVEIVQRSTSTKLKIL